MQDRILRHLREEKIAIYPRYLEFFMHDLTCTSSIKYQMAINRNKKRETLHVLIVPSSDNIYTLLVYIFIFVIGFD